MISFESWTLMRIRSARELVDEGASLPYEGQPQILCKAAPGNHWASHRLLCIS